MPSMFASLAAFASTLSRKPSSGRYRPELDGLRCLAILIVMVWHASLKVMRFTSDSAITETAYDPKVSLIPDGAVGVQLFFFLSGYVICRPFFSPRRQPIGQFIRGFYRSRLIRIVPPYALVLLVSYLAIAVLGFTPQKASTFELVKTELNRSFLASIFYMHGLIFSAPPKFNPPGWSLEIEMQFYIIVPFIMFLYISSNNRMNRVFFGLFFIISSIILRVFLVNTYGEYGYFRWTLLNYFPVFMLGIVMADLTWETQPQRPLHTRWPDLLCLASAIALLAVGVLRHPMGWVEQGLVDTTTLVAIVGLYYGATWGKAANWLLSRPAIAVTGAACYSLYLTHMLLMHFTGAVLFKAVRLSSYPLNWLLGMLVLIPVSILGGFVFYIVVERLFIRLAAGRPAAAAHAPPTARIV